MYLSDHHLDPVWMRVLLYSHISMGFGAFLLAPVALATTKGGKQHKRWGMVYLWCMGGVAATALPMAIYRPVLFLALVAVFSFYLAFSAYRITKLKSLATGGSAQPVDWAAAVFTFGASACLAIFGVVRPAWVQHMGIVAIVFGIIGMVAPLVEMQKFIFKRTRKMFWIYTHMGNFIGSYIAAWTAFGVTSLAPQFGGGAIMWLWPTIVGVPAIIFTLRYYRRKFETRPSVSA